MSYADQVVLLDERGRVTYSGVPDSLRLDTRVSWTLNSSQDLRHYRNFAPLSIDSPQDEAASGYMTDTETLNTEKNVLEVDLSRQTGDTKVYEFYAKSAGWTNFAIFALSMVVFAFCDSFPSRSFCSPDILYHVTNSLP